MSAVALLALLALDTPTALAAQRAPLSSSPSQIMAEFRLDAIAARSTTVQLGGALLHGIGPSLRLGGVVGVGRTHGSLDDHGENHGTENSVRVEALARFVIDAPTESRWRPYGQAGLGVLWVRGATGRPLVSAVVGARHDAIGPIRPAVELGLGGGLRVAVVAGF